jgi:DNA topoisomerase-6 subunit B
VAISVVSPFIKFKNASKETIDASDELVEELRLALIQAGQRLSRHINKERRAEDLEQKIRHIEQFGPILIACIGRITKAPEKSLVKAKEGLMKLLGRDAEHAENELAVAEEKHAALKAKQDAKLGKNAVESEAELEEAPTDDAIEPGQMELSPGEKKPAKGKPGKSKKSKEVQA